MGSETSPSGGDRTQSGDSESSPNNTPDKLVFLTTMGLGTLLIMTAVGCSVAGLQFLWGKWIMACGIGLLCGGTASRIAVSLKLPMIGQTVTLGGTFGAVFLLLTQVPDPQSALGRGSIQLRPGLQDVVLRTGHTPLYFRREDDRTIEFLVTPEELQAKYWHISLSIVDGQIRRPKFINCLPREILAGTMKKPINLVLRQVPKRNGDGSNDLVFGIEEESHPGPVLGVPDEAAICGSQDDGVEHTNANVTPSDESHKSQPLESIIPVSAKAPGSEEKKPDLADDGTRALHSASLDQRLLATSTIGSAVSASNDAIVRTVNTWNVSSSDYDDDLGRLLGWLKALRRTEQDPSGAKDLLIALTPAQCSYLIALLANQDRPLRLAARETVGWLLLASAGTTVSNKLLVPVMEGLRGPTPSVKQIEEKYQTPSRSRPFFVYHLVDVQLDPWCRYTEEQRRQMLQILTQIPATDIRNEGAGKISELRVQKCST
jgi:hypothetical protein